MLKALPKAIVKVVIPAALPEPGVFYLKERHSITTDPGITIKIAGKRWRAQLKSM